MNTDLLNSGRLDLEMRRDVAAEHTSLKCFYVSTNVRLRCDQVSVIHLAMCFLVTIWHNNLAVEGFNL